MNVAFGLARPLDVASALPSPDAFAEPQPVTLPAPLYHYLWPVAAGTDCQPCEDVFAAKVVAEK